MAAKLSPNLERARQEVEEAIRAFHVLKWEEEGEPVDTTMLMSFVTVAHFQDIEEGEVVSIYPVITSRGSAPHSTVGLLAMAEETLSNEE